MPEPLQLTIDGRHERLAPVQAPESSLAPRAPAPRLFDAPQTIRGQIALATDTPPELERSQDLTAATVRP